MVVARMAIAGRAVLAAIMCSPVVVLWPVLRVGPCGDGLGERSAYPLAARGRAGFGSSGFGSSEPLELERFEVLSESGAFSAELFASLGVGPDIGIGERFIDGLDA